APPHQPGGAGASPARPENACQPCEGIARLPPPRAAAGRIPIGAGAAVQFNWILSGVLRPAGPLPGGVVAGGALRIESLTFGRRRRDAVLILQPLKLRWIQGAADDPKDLCAHGDVEFRIGDDVLLDTNGKDLTVSAAALYLLRTLSV